MPSVTITSGHRHRRHGGLRGFLRRLRNRCFSVHYRR